MSELLPTYRGAVYPWHCDHMGHMNVMWYVGKFDEATWNLFAHLGITPAYMRETGSATAAVDQRLQYRKELLAGDTLSVGSGLLEVRDKAVVFFHEMRNNESGEVSATCRLVGVHLDTGTRRAKPWPTGFRERAGALIRPYDFGDRS